MKTSTITMLAVLFAAGSVGLTAACNAKKAEHEEAHGMHHSHGMHAATPVAEAPPLPEGVVGAGNKTCPITGEAVNNADYVVYQGKRYGLCCAGCDVEFLKDPEKYIKILKDRGDIQ